MNERIRDLAEQAFFDEDTSNTPSVKIYTFSEYKMEKFAKLLIWECAHHLNSVGDDYAGIELLEHFGVK